MALQENIEDWSIARNIEVSTEAAAIIGTLVEGILHDPHPSWRENSDDDDPKKPDIKVLFGVKKNAEERVQDFLNQVAETQNCKEVLTCWDVMHAGIDWIDAFCPFRKLPT